MRDASFEGAAELFVGLVARVPDSAWEGPGLGAWDVRALVGHTSRSLTTVLTYLDQRPDGVAVGSAAEYYVAIRPQLEAVGPDAAEAIVERGREAGRALGDDPSTAVRELLARTLARLGDASPDDLMHTAAGGMRVRDYLPTRVLELVVHSRDLARALGLDLDVPPELLRVVAVLAAEIAVEVGDGPLVLDALLGRGVLPEGFSLV